MQPAELCLFSIRPQDKNGTNMLKPKTKTDKPRKRGKYEGKLNLEMPFHEAIKRVAQAPPPPKPKK